MLSRDMEETGHGAGLTVGHEERGEVSRMVPGFLARMADAGGWGVIYIRLISCCRCEIGFWVTFWDSH